MADGSKPTDFDSLLQNGHDLKGAKVDGVDGV
jgi:hypothetical protein